ncbi:hypothetical protein [Streptomyces lancefieldiae]|uniref:Uncharacterized protein n=1 Tax=Streptomyces lancefieldiae TaxID=3075520 RepID=A0ABU3AYJ7_9ACTN|nr:hypothetical protein [Streptomyces sp. DSM 40712]MDT0615262.1 hypothetical protein [Streptomyces sp. DSM 40712]
MDGTGSVRSAGKSAAADRSGAKLRLTARAEDTRGAPTTARAAVVTYSVIEPISTHADVQSKSFYIWDRRTWIPYAVDSDTARSVVDRAGRRPGGIGVPRRPRQTGETVTLDSPGRLKTTAAAPADGYGRYTMAGPSTTTPVIAPDDCIDVRRPASYRAPAETPFSALGRVVLAPGRVRGEGRRHLALAHAHRTRRP